VRVLTWNLYHGRSRPPAGRGLLREFATTLAGWSWDVALLQEVPPWWPPALAAAAGADHRTVLTSRNWVPPLQRAIGRRNPDLLKSNGGGANAILARVAVTDHRARRLTRLPERRWAHGIRLADGAWVVNVHATNEPKPRTHLDVAAAADAAREWADGAPFVLGGDLNLRDGRVDGLDHVAGHHVDHILVRGLEFPGAPEVLDAGPLSDHRPLAVTVGAG
jgi:endonuclease/exonuclease/phosphatase family metal-dependent hydrolase